MFLRSLGNTSRHFRAVERPLSGRGSVDQSEATEHWRFPGLFRVMRFISSRNTNGPENQVGISAIWTSPFCRFLASFSLKYDVTDAMLQDIGKMKVQYLMSFLFDLFEILQAVRSEQMNFA